MSGRCIFFVQDVRDVCASQVDASGFIGPNYRSLDPAFFDNGLGKPVFKGTRLTVELVLKALGAGTTQEELLAEFPHLKPEHIRAAMLFAADVLTMDA